MKVDLRAQHGYLPYKSNPFERAFDAAVRVFAPRTALMNRIHRERSHQLGYEGARITRARMNATRAGTITSNTPLNSSDRLQLVWEARDLQMNDPFIHGLFDKMAHYVIGPKIRIESMCPDPADNAMLEDYIYECMEHCDLTGRARYTELSRLSFISILRDGDFGQVPHIVADPTASQVMGRPISWVKLQCCESDVIGGYHYWIEDGVVSGVEFDKNTGEVLNYRIYPRNNFGYYQAEYTAVPADQMFFMPYRQRTDQYRGISAIASAIPTARDIKEIISMEKFGVKWASSWAGFITVAPGDAAAADPASVYQGQLPTDLPIIGTGGVPVTVERTYEQFIPGQIGYLSPGEKIESAKTDRPSPTFNGFAALLYRQICASVNMPFGFAFDTSILGGVPSRLESAQAKRTCEYWQCFYDDHGHQPFFARCMANGIATGRLRFRNLSRLPKIVVNPPAHPTVDVGRESRANVTEYESGLRSFSSIVREAGGNPREEIERMANDAQMKIDVAKQRGIPLELIEPQMTPGAGSSRGNGQSGGGGGSDAAGVSALSKVVRSLKRSVDDLLDHEERKTDGNGPEMNGKMNGHRRAPLPLSHN